MGESRSTQSGNKTDYPSSMNEKVSALNIQNKILKTRAYINENLIHSVGKQQIKTYLWIITTIWDTFSNVLKTDRQMGRKIKNFHRRKELDMTGCYTHDSVLPWLHT